MNSYMTWFRRVLLAGVFVNLCLGIPGMIAPNLILEITRQRPCEDLFWGRFAAFLIILVTLMDIPAALNPVRYRAVAWLAVFNRISGVLFFLLWRREYLVFGFLDLTFGILSLPLLYLLERKANRATTAHPFLSSTSVHKSLF